MVKQKPPAESVLTNSVIFISRALYDDITKKYFATVNQAIIYNYFFIKSFDVFARQKRRVSVSARKCEQWVKGPWHDILPLSICFVKLSQLDL